MGEFRENINGVISDISDFFEPYRSGYNKNNTRTESRFRINGKSVNNTLHAKFYKSAGSSIHKTVPSQYIDIGNTASSNNVETPMKGYLPSTLQLYRLNGPSASSSNITRYFVEDGGGRMWISTSPSTATGTKLTLTVNSEELIPKSFLIELQGAGGGGGPGNGGGGGSGAYRAVLIGSSNLYKFTLNKAGEGGNSGNSYNAISGGPSTLYFTSSTSANYVRCGGGGSGYNGDRGARGGSGGTAFANDVCSRYYNLYSKSGFSGGATSVNGTSSSAFTLNLNQFTGAANISKSYHSGGTRESGGGGGGGASPFSDGANGTGNAVPTKAGIGAGGGGSGKNWLGFWADSGEGGNGTIIIRY